MHSSVTMPAIPQVRLPAATICPEEEEKLDLNGDGSSGNCKCVFTGITPKGAKVMCSYNVAIIYI